MKNVEVLHTLRLYDSDFIAKLGTLMEREQNNYRNKNEFLTAVLKKGLESYAVVGQADEADTVRESPSATVDSRKDAYALLREMNEYMVLQFKMLSLYQEIYQKMLSAIYRMQLSMAGGEKVIQKSVEAGFFDDLPERFEKLVVNLKTQFGF